MSVFYVVVAIVVCAALSVPIWTRDFEDSWRKICASVAAVGLALLLIGTIILDTGMTLNYEFRNAMAIRSKFKTAQAELAFELTNLARKTEVSQGTKTPRILAIARAEQASGVGSAVRAVLDQRERYTEEMRTRDISAAIEAHAKVEKSLRAAYSKMQLNYGEFTEPHSRGYWAMRLLGLPESIQDWPEEVAGTPDAAEPKAGRALTQ